jgi:hypothetical protein
VATRRIPPPYRGVSNATPYYETPGDLCPPGSMLNVRTFVPTEDRASVGQRPGIAKKFAQRLGNGAALQAMRAVTRASVVSGYNIGSCSAITDNWDTKDGTPQTGQVFLLRNNLGQYYAHYENVSASGTAPVQDTHATDPSEQAVTCIACNPGGSRFVFGSTYADATRDVARITCIDAATGAVQWSHKIERPADVFVNSVCCDNEFVFVCTNQYVRVLRLSTGALLTDRNLDQWSSETMQACISADGDYLYATFLGSDAATMSGGPTVTTGKYAQYFRAGVMKWQINHGDPVTPLTRIVYGAQLDDDETYYERTHNYLRFSEVFPIAPRGVWPTSIAAMPDGGVVVGHTNNGWGPTVAFTPDNSAFDKKTVTLLDDSGAIVWQADTESINAVNEGGVYNDIEFDGSGQIFSSVLAVAADAQGNVYTGGRRVGVSGNYGTVFKLNAGDGSEVWRFNTGQDPASATVRSIYVDPTDGNLWVSGDRNTSWTGASGASAHLWKLSSVDGALLAYYDLNVASVSGLGVCVDQNGRIGYCTDRIP